MFLMAKDSKYYELIVALKPLLPDDVRKEIASGICKYGDR